MFEQVFKKFGGAGLSWVALFVATSAFAQKVSSPPAIDGALVFAPTADTTLYGNNASSGTVDTIDLAGEPVPTWFGLWCFSTRHAELTFSPGSTLVSSAKLYLYNYYYEGFTAPGTALNVTGTTTVRGVGGMTFTEPDAGFKIATSQPTLLASDTAWATQGTFTITGSDGTTTTPGSEVGWYAVDVTSLWNANRGGTLTLAIRFAAAAGADGPIFEDRGGVAYAHGCYGAIPASGPRIVTVVPNVGTPTVNSFSLMYPGAAGAVPGYDPITNGTTINLFLTGTNLNVRANTTPATDFGSVVFNLTGATTRLFTENGYPWALFGDTSGSYSPGQFNIGAHALTATPYSSDGGAGSNGVALTISFTVTNSAVLSNGLPSVTLTSPANGNWFAAPATIPLEATASDADGSVTNVEFFSSATRIGVASAPPFSFLWTNVASGPYALTARATDNQGGSRTSAVVNISVLSTNRTGQPWIFPGATWNVSKTPESLGVIGANLDTLANNLGPGSSGCVIKNGYLIYSWGDPTAGHNWASASKPCFSTLLFYAINEGKVASPDSLLLPYWPGLRPIDQTMTFRHLADMMSGYACDDRDASQNLLPPGSRWAYNDYAIQLYARTLDKVFGGNGGLPSGSLSALVSAGDQRFTGPLQFQDGVLFESAKGRVKSSPRDYARLGWFWLTRGNWNGTQLLPKHFFDDYRKADVPLGTPETVNQTADDYLGVGSYGGGINQGDGQGIYGFNWWYNNCLTIPPRSPALLTWPAAPADTYMALGRAGKDGMIIIPSLGMVVAAYNDNVASWGDAIITDPADTGSTMNQNLQLLTEAVPIYLPLPRFASVSAVAGTLTMSGSNGLPFGDFYLLAGTNSVEPASNWTRVATNRFDAAGSFKVTNNVDPQLPQSFYRLQLP